MKSKAYQFAKLYVAKLGMSIFPLRPRDKRPLTAHGFKDCSDNLAQIDRWWGSNPKAGVGLPTGQRNGVVVVDFDPRNSETTMVDNEGITHTRGAEDMAAELFGENMPDTWIAETGGGGLHVFFKHPGARLLPGLGNWRPGIDLKSDGGYVVVPPSIHPSGVEYRWIQKPGEYELAPLPEEIEAALVNRQKAQVDKEIQGNITDGSFTSGHRNESLTSLAGSMQRRNMDPQAILAALLAENAAKCSPPLDEHEVLTIANSVGRYEPDDEASPALKVMAKKEIAFAAIADMIKEPPEIEWIIPGRLARGDCALIVGPPGCGKSWITMDLAISTTLGKKVMGEWPVTKPLRVLYVDEENPRDEVNRRLHGIFNATVQNGAREGQALELAARLHLMEPCQGFTFKEKEGWLRPLTDLVSKIEPDLIILDSMTALSGIIDENKATEVRGFFHDKLYPLRRICNSAILAVHHSNKKAYETAGNETTSKDGQIRGSIDYLGAVDACLFAAVAKDKESGDVVSRTLHQAKQRRDREPPAVQWDLQGGKDHDGLLCLRPLVVDGYVKDHKGSSVTAFIPAEKRGNEPHTLYAGMSKTDVVRWAKLKWRDSSATELEGKIQDHTRRMDISLETIRNVLDRLDI